MPQGLPVLTFPAGGTNFAFLVREHNMYITREVGIVRSGAGKLKGGTVMTLATGKYDPWVALSTNAVILMEDVDATSQDVKRTMLVRMSEVQRAELFFAGALTDPQKALAYAQLAANFVIMR